MVYSSTSNFQLLPEPSNPKCQMAQMLWLPSFFLCFLRPVDTDENKQSIFLVVGNRLTLRWMILSRDPFQMTYVDVPLTPWFITERQRNHWSSPWFSCLHPTYRICFNGSYALKSITNWLQLMTRYPISFSRNVYVWMALNVWCSHLQTVPMLTWGSRTSTAASCFWTYDDQKDRTPVNKSWTGL